MSFAKEKEKFKINLKTFVTALAEHIQTDDKQWAVKGFIDVYKNIYTISADTKIVSKILEIHLFPKILVFARKHKYNLVLTDHQNYYPDISFVSEANPELKFAVDLKTTYRLEDKPAFCNGFTLGSHGEYFINRQSRKNIQFPYAEYAGHFCLGAIYSRAVSDKLAEARVRQIGELRSIVSVVRNFQFFVCEKWEIPNDRYNRAQPTDLPHPDFCQLVRNGARINCAQTKMPGILRVGKLYVLPALAIDEILAMPTQRKAVAELRLVFQAISRFQIHRELQILAGFTDK